MAPKRDRRRAPAVPDWAWALEWYEQLPEGPCRQAVELFRDERRRAGANNRDALMAYEMNSSVVPDPWHNESVQAGIRSSLLALRQLREERALAEQAAAAALADIPAQPDAVAPFTGAGHRLG